MVRGFVAGYNRRVREIDVDEIGDPACRGAEWVRPIDEVTMWTYPDKALKAEFQPKLTQQGTSKDDHDSENVLMGMGAENAVQSFTKVAASL